MAVSDYDTNPANNTSISATDVSEGCNPAGINNAIRQMMADVKSFYDVSVMEDADSILGDDVSISFGAGEDAKVEYVSASNKLTFTMASGVNLEILDSMGRRMFVAFEAGAGSIYHQGTQRAVGTSSGFDVFGDLDATGDLSASGDLNITGTVTVGGDVWSPAIQKGADVSTGLDMIGYGKVTDGSNATMAFEEGVTTTYTSSGRYAVAFDTARSDTNYMVMFSGTSGTTNRVFNTANETVNGFTIEARRGSDSVLGDTEFSYQIFAQSS